MRQRRAVPHVFFIFISHQGTNSRRDPGQRGRSRLLQQQTTRDMTTATRHAMARLFHNVWHTRGNFVHFDGSQNTCLFTISADADMANDVLALRAMTRGTAELPAPATTDAERDCSRLVPFPRLTSGRGPIAAGAAAAAELLRSSTLMFVAVIWGRLRGANLGRFFFRTGRLQLRVHPKARLDSEADRCLGVRSSVHSGGTLLRFFGPIP